MENSAPLTSIAINWWTKHLSLGQNCTCKMSQYYVFLFPVQGMHRKLEELKAREGNRDSRSESKAGDSYQKWGTALCNWITCIYIPDESFHRLSWCQGALSWISWKRRVRDCRSHSQLNFHTPRDCKMRYTCIPVLVYEFLTNNQSILFIGSYFPLLFI